jgi:hypothetical protein
MNRLFFKVSKPSNLSLCRSVQTFTKKEKEEGLKSKQSKFNRYLCIGLTSFILGIYYYSMHVVSQDEFSDVDRNGNVSVKIKY